MAVMTGFCLIFHHWCCCLFIFKVKTRIHTVSKNTHTEVFSKKLEDKSVNGKLSCATECDFKSKTVYEICDIVCVLYSFCKRKLVNSF